MQHNIQKRTKRKLVNDNLVNCVSGQGSTNDKRGFGRFTRTRQRMNPRELEAMYAESWIANKVITIIPEDMVREWRSIKTEDLDSDKVKQFAQEEVRLDLQGKIFEALMWARLYGGSVIMPIIEDAGHLSDPLDLSKVKQGSLKSLAVLDSSNIFPYAGVCQDPTNPRYLKPEFYSVTGAMNRKIHHSRFIRFDGVPLPNFELQKNNYWGDSIIPKMYEAIRDAESIIGSVASMMQEMNVDQVSIEGLSEMLAAKRHQEIEDRFALNNTMKSNWQMQILDSKEQLSNRTLQLSGMSQIMETGLTIASGASDIPVTRFIGTSAKGLNATGEGDLRNYYDSIAAKQTNQLKAPLMTLDLIIMQSLFGEVVEDYDFEFNPLYQESRTDIATRQFNDSQRDTNYLTMGVVTEDIVAKQLKDDGVYTNISEEFIKALEDAVNEEPEEDLENGEA